MYLVSAPVKLVNQVTGHLKLLWSSGGHAVFKTHEDKDQWVLCCTMNNIYLQMLSPIWYCTYQSWSFGRLVPSHCCFMDTQDIHFEWIVITWYRNKYYIRSPTLKLGHDTLLRWLVQNGSGSAFGHIQNWDSTSPKHILNVLFLLSIMWGNIECTTDILTPSAGDLIL